MTDLVTLEKTTRKKDLLLCSSIIVTYKVMISANAVRELVNDDCSKRILSDFLKLLEEPYAGQSKKNGDLMFEFNTPKRINEFLEDIRSIMSNIPMNDTLRLSLMENKQMGVDTLYNHMKQLVFRTIYNDLFEKMSKQISHERFANKTP